MSKRPENTRHVKCPGSEDAFDAYCKLAGASPDHQTFVTAFGAKRAPYLTGKRRKHLVIPDVQAKPGVDLSHLAWIGKYIVDKRPDVVVCIGDFADMESLSSYDKGKKRFEGRRYKRDIEVAIKAMEMLLGPLRALQAKQKAAGEPVYRPRLVFTLGNHEYRILRAIDDDAKLDGTISIGDLKLKEFGWEVYDFLDVVEIDGVEYAHYFTSGVMGRPVSSARAMLTSRMKSCIMGHVQHTDVSFHPKTQQIAIMVGTAYLHDEDYLGLQGNDCRRQVVMLHEVNRGRFDPMFVSLDYLRRKYAA